VPRGLPGFCLTHDRNESLEVNPSLHHCRSRGRRDQVVAARDADVDPVRAENGPRRLAGDDGVGIAMAIMVQQNWRDRLLGAFTSPGDVNSSACKSLEWARAASPLSQQVARVGRQVAKTIDTAGRPHDLYGFNPVGLSQAEVESRVGG
jgi:hypothetical protein